MLRVLARHLGRHRALLSAAVVSLAICTGIGAIASAGLPHYAHARGVTCVFHGWRALEQIRHRHPAWTTYHLWRASRTCTPAPWRY